MGKLKIGVLVSGRGSNLQAIIDEIEAGKLDAEIKIVISNKAEAYSLERAAKHGIQGLVINHKDFQSREDFDQAMVEALRGQGVELVVTAGFMRLLTPYFIREFKGRIINTHPALLPSFPGIHGAKDAVEYGVKVSGCTIFFVDEGVDTGPIISQGVVEVADDDTEETLAAKILVHEHKLLPEAIKLFASGNYKIEGRRVKITAQKD